MTRIINKEESQKQFLKAVDVVCMACAFLSEEVCETCPGRKTVDLMNKES